MAHVFAHSQGKTYAATWSKYRRNTRRLILAYLGLVPAEFVTYGIFDSMFGDAIAKDALYATFVLCGLTIQVYESLIRMFRCPCCKKRFFASRHRHSMFARRCLNCGLPKYALHNPDD